jgi:hypothetical protein
MPKTTRQYEATLNVQISRDMRVDLETIARKSNLSLAEVARRALRNAIDGTDLTLGTRKAFDRRFRDRLDGLEQKLGSIFQDRLDEVEQIVHGYLKALVFLCLLDFPVAPESDPPPTPEERLSYVLGLVDGEPGDWLHHKIVGRNSPVPTRRIREDER